MFAAQIPIFCYECYFRCSMCLLSISKLHKIRSTAGQKTALSAQQIGNIVIRTVLSNVCAVLSILLLKEMEVSMYTILSAALGLIGNVIISKLVFKEQVDKETLAAVILAIGAIAANP